MSVIVKNMEMPSWCQSCDFSDDETRFCKAAKEYIPMVGKPWFCPLVELPEKHGRLIDADDFSAVMKERQLASAKWLREAKDVETINRAGAVFAVLCEVKRTIGKLPTIVEAEGE